MGGRFSRPDVLRLGRTDECADGNLVWDELQRRMGMDPSGGGADLRRLADLDIATFTPVVTYTYVVNGQAQQCDRVRFSPTRSKKILAKYPKGNPGQVFFDPRHPSTAVLEKGGSTRVMMFVGIAVIVGSWLVGILIGSL